MFNAKEKEALQKAGVSLSRIASAEKAMRPQFKLKPKVIKRIEALVAEDGIAHVTRGKVFSDAGWHMKKTAGAATINAARKAHLLNRATPKTPADIAASLK